MSSRYKRFQIYLDPAQKPKLERIRRRLGLPSQSALIRAYIDEGLARDERRRKT